jgi:hypothetical protein
MRCERVRDLLPGIVDGSTVATRLTRVHVSRCLRCQAELAQYRRLRRAARSLADDPPPAPPDLLEMILSRVEELPARTSARARRMGVVITGAATAAAGAVAGALVLTRRARTS